jgi:hypothetical protein
LAVFDEGGSSSKGEWTQSGDQLLLVLDSPVMEGSRKRVERGESRRLMDIDLVDDTTLVLTGELSRDAKSTATFIRVK